MATNQHQVREDGHPRGGADRADRDGRGADAMPVLIRAEQLSRVLRFDKLFRLKVLPLAISMPWGISPAALPQFAFAGEDPDQT